MVARYLLPALALAFSATAANVAPFDGRNVGWCYFCSDAGAPPLCNKDCTTAYKKLCATDLTQNWIELEGSCQIEYSPPVWKGEKPIAPTQATCEQGFQTIINSCGKNAASSDPAAEDFCTESGGGGTYGWNDDGSPMTGTGRYRIIPKGVSQCGQHKATWEMADKIIEWDDQWVGPDDQVVLDTSPPPEECPAPPEAQPEAPPPTAPAGQEAPSCDIPLPPPPNPLCETEECDIFGKPYYVNKGGPNWQETSGYTRFQVRWQDWADDAQGTQLKKSVTDRCHMEPYNWQAWEENNEHIADLELKSSDKNSLCWCISDAVYDASVGIRTDPSNWCEGAATKGNLLDFQLVG
ncbi:MAG: hypothetical protein Q9183_006174 [Haloplaca sp. 2 TL-2023]